MKDVTAPKMREATPEDLDALWLLWKEIQDQKVYFAYDSSTTKEAILDTWITLRNHVFVAELEDEIVGGYVMKPNQPGHGSHVVNAAYLVSSEHRGHGLGHLLCEHSIQTAKELGYRGMQFNLVVSTNVSAITVWEKYGFEIIGTIPGGFYHHEEGYVDAYIYYKILTA